MNHLETIVSTMGNADLCFFKHNTKLKQQKFLSATSLRLKEQLLKKSLKQPSPSMLTIHIRYYQFGLTWLLDELTIKGCACIYKAECVKSNIQPLKNQLREVLCFINEQFYNFIDADHKLPNCCYELFKQQVKQDIRELMLQLQEYNIEDEMIHLVLHPFVDLIQGKTESYSYKDKAFLEHWMNHLKSTSKLLSDKDDKCKYICSQLIACNLNSEICIDFLNQFITAKYTKATTHAEQIDILHYFAKCIKQTTIITSHSYHPHMPSLQEVLINWINQEQAYLNSTSLSHEHADSSRHHKPVINKVQTNLSVSKLAAYLRISVESGIYPVDNSRELIRHFSDHFATHKTNAISFDSLYNKYYSPEKGAIDDVKEYILKKLKLIQGNFFLTFFHQLNYSFS